MMQRYIRCSLTFSTLLWQLGLFFFLVYFRASDIERGTEVDTKDKKVLVAMCHGKKKGQKLLFPALNVYVFR